MSPQGETHPPASNWPLAVPQVSCGLTYASSVRRACDLYTILSLCFQTNSRAGSWDVDSLFVRQGSCCHLLVSCHVQVKRFFLLHVFSWKVSRVKTHLKEAMYLLLSLQEFCVCGFRFPHSSLSTLLLYDSFYFLSLALPGARLLSSNFRAKGRPDYFASLKLWDNEKSSV